MREWRGRNPALPLVRRLSPSRLVLRWRHAGWGWRGRNPALPGLHASPSPMRMRGSVIKEGNPGAICFPSPMRARERGVMSEMSRWSVSQPMRMQTLCRGNTDSPLHPLTHSPTHPFTYSPPHRPTFFKVTKCSCMAMAPPARSQTSNPPLIKALSRTPLPMARLSTGSVCPNP